MKPFRVSTGLRLIGFHKGGPVCARLGSPNLRSPLKPKFVALSGGVHRVFLGTGALLALLLLFLTACGPGGPTGVTLIAAGNAHTCAAFWDGTTKCWGLNAAGQLGNGTYTSSNVPVQVTGLPFILGLAAGGVHTCAIMLTGTMKCWGYNGEGELGNGTSGTLSNVPQDVVNITQAVWVAAGEDNTCAVYQGQNVACWGYDGIRGTGNPAAVQGISANAIAIGRSVPRVTDLRACAIELAGTVKCWNPPVGAAPTLIQGITATVIAVGSAHACVIEPAGTVKCWGRNDVGQLGDGTNVDSNVPVPVAKPFPLNGPITALAAGGDHTCAVSSDGHVWCWGFNYWGQLGNAKTQDSPFPVPVLAPNGQGVLSNAVAVALGGGHSCAIFVDGNVRKMACWGRNIYGQLGNGSNNSSSTPVTPSGLP